MPSRRTARTGRWHPDRAPAWQAPPRAGRATSAGPGRPAPRGRDRGSGSGSGSAPSVVNALIITLPTPSSAFTTEDSRQTARGEMLSCTSAAGKRCHIAPRGAPIVAVEALARVRHGPLRLYVASLGLVGVVGIVGRHLKRQVRALAPFDALHHREPLLRAKGHRLVQHDGVVAAVLHLFGLARRRRAVGGAGRVAVEQYTSTCTVEPGFAVVADTASSTSSSSAVNTLAAATASPNAPGSILAHARSAQVIILVVRIVAERAVRIGQIDQEGRGLANAHVVVRQVETAVQAPVGAPAVLDDPRTSGGRPAWQDRWKMSPGRSCRPSPRW